MCRKSFDIAILCYFFVRASGQHPEINDQFESNKTSDEDMSSNFTPNSNNNDTNATMTNISNTIPKNNHTLQTSKLQRIIVHFYKVICVPIEKIFSIPKVNNILRNVGTCIVNGVMELVTYYLPAPFIPLIASVAGMVIPFEPVVTLRRRMPVTSYRRAIQQAVSGFMNTFDRFKNDNDDDDPYMTRRFNRRFMTQDSKENKTL